MRMKKKYNIQELEEKLKRCRNMKLEDVTLDDVDELSSIKIDRRNKYYYSINKR